MIIPSGDGSWSNEEDAHARLTYFSYAGREYLGMGITGEWTAVESEERAALIEHR